MTKRPSYLRPLPKKARKSQQVCIDFLNSYQGIPDLPRQWALEKFQWDHAFIQQFYAKIILLDNGDLRQDSIYTGIWDARLQEISILLHKSGDNAALEELIYSIRHQNELSREEGDTLSLLMWQADHHEEKKFQEAIWYYTNKALREHSSLYQGYGYNVLNFENFAAYQTFLKENYLYQSSRIDKVLDRYLCRFHLRPAHDTILWEMKRWVKKDRALWRKIIQGEGRKIYHFSIVDQTVGEYLDEKIQERDQNRFSKNYYTRYTQYHTPLREQENRSVEESRKVLSIPLGLQLTNRVIRQYFRKKALQVHPDMGGSRETFYRIQEAKNTLLKSLNDDSI